MAKYVILSRVSPEAFADPAGFRQLARAVSTTIKEECPGVKWIGSYSTLGRFDVVDVVEADDHRQVEKAAVIIRSIGHSITETMPATPWDEFLDGL